MIFLFKKQNYKKLHPKFPEEKEELVEPEL